VHPPPCDLPPFPTRRSSDLAIQAFQELRAFSQVWGTSYGRVLLVKIGVIGTMIPLSFIAWRRRLFRRTEGVLAVGVVVVAALLRSEEHTSELQSRFDLVCRL